MSKSNPTINLKKSSLQRIFEFGLKHVRAQGKPAMARGSCAMRGEEGTMCVVGSMISDELARRCDLAMESPEKVLSSPAKIVPEWFALIGKNPQKYTLLADMQNAHDGAEADDFLADFESRMQKVAGNFGLTYKAPGASLRT
jgi:hypothetical protein